jgi:hypothetical protein
VDEAFEALHAIVAEVEFFQALELVEAFDVCNPVRL